MWMRGYLFQLAAQLAVGAQAFDTSLRTRVLEFLRQNQAKDGGFCGREMGTGNLLISRSIPNDERHGDLYYTAFGLRILAMLGIANASILAKCGPFLHTQRNTVQGVSLPEWISWFQSLKILTALGGEHTPLSRSEELSFFRQRLMPLIRTPGCFSQTGESREISIYATFLIHTTLELLDDDVSTEKGTPSDEKLPAELSSIRSTVLHSTSEIPRSVIQFLSERQNSDGGFSELASLSRSGLNPTAAAIALWTMMYTCHSDVEINRKTTSKPLMDGKEIPNLLRAAIFGTIRFLSTVRGPHGGFYAHTSLPSEDLLSTFTALVTMRDVETMVQDLSLPLTVSEREKLIQWIMRLKNGVRSFVESLWWKDSGFRAGLFDEMTDIEYTFYGLGCLALCEKTDQ